MVTVRDWPGFSLGFTTAHAGGNPPGLQSADRRLDFYTSFNISSVHEAEQVHDNILHQARSQSACYRSADGLTAARPGAMLTILTADCYTVYLKGSQNSRYGIVHAGWKGLDASIVKKAVDNWFSSPVDVIIGPGITPSDYEVGDEVIDRMQNSFGLTREDFEQLGFLNDSKLDLKKIIQWQLAESENEIDTCQEVPYSTTRSRNPDLLSYRENGTDDRMLNWIYSLEE